MRINTGSLQTCVESTGITLDKTEAVVNIGDTVELNATIAPENATYKNPFASHKDRHEKIGEGSIGLEAFERMVNHPKLKGIPIYLETPNELEGYAREIRVLREMER